MLTRIVKLFGHPEVWTNLVGKKRHSGERGISLHVYGKNEHQS